MYEEEKSEMKLFAKCYGNFIVQVTWHDSIESCFYQKMQFKLEKIDCWVHLGVPKWERENKQKILVSLDFSYDTGKAEISDNVTDTIDYFEIYKLVKNFCGEGEYRLIEKLHRDLCEKIQSNFPQISDLKIMIEKKPFSDASISLYN